MSRSQFKVMGLSFEFRVRSISPLPLGGFHLNFGQMFTCGTIWWTHNSRYGDSRTRSQFKVACLSPEFRVHSISPLHQEGFSFIFGQMFASVKWCADPIAQPCRLTKSQFKVTGFSPLYISFTPGRIFSKLQSNVHLSGTMCWTHISAMQT